MRTDPLTTVANLLNRAADLIDPDTDTEGPTTMDTDTDTDTGHTYFSEVNGRHYTDMTDTTVDRSHGRHYTDLYGMTFTTFPAYLIDAELQCERCIDNVWTGDPDLGHSSTLQGQRVDTDLIDLGAAHECCVSCGRYFDH